MNQIEIKKTNHPYSKGVKIEIDRLPPSVNHIWKHSGRGGFARTYMSKEGKDFKKFMHSVIEHPQLISPINVLPLFPGDTNVKVQIFLTFPTRRKQDIDNYCKGILDSMAGKIYIDDSQITELFVTKTYQKGVTACTILVEEIT